MTNHTNVSLTSALMTVLTAEDHYMLLTPAYPGAAGLYGGEFVRSRVLAYKAQGLRGTVVEVARRNVGAQLETVDGIRVIRLPLSRLGQLVELFARIEVPLLAHSPSPAIQHALIDHAIPGRVAIWFHGFEVRDYRRLFANRTSRELAKVRSGLNADNDLKFKAARRIFTDPGIKKVFVSKFLKDVAEFDVGVEALSSYVIPNHIDGEFFFARRRQEADGKRILLLRSFAARNYANDIAIEALRILSTRKGFKDAQITVRGFGARFREETSPISGHSNVEVVERYSSRAEMCSVFFDHGIFLCPSRFDTQGVTLGEAMSSGLACVTNSVAAIPEFVDERSAVLARPDDPWDYAETLWSLMEDPYRVSELSVSAASRVRQQCGRSQTIDKELDLMEALK